MAYYTHCTHKNIQGIVFESYQSNLSILDNMETTLLHSTIFLVIQQKMIPRCLLLPQETF